MQARSGLLLLFIYLSCSTLILGNDAHLFDVYNGCAQKKRLLLFYISPAVGGDHLKTLLEGGTRGLLFLNNNIFIFKSLL